MLKSICFSNFVKFKEYHYLDFSNDSPFIFIGENGTGKSSVLEGIRRCLNPQLSTSVSSIPDPEKLSYFICNFENVDGNENVLSGIVAMPDELENENTDSSGNNSTDEVDYDPSSALLYQEPNSAEQQEPVPFSGENQEEEMNKMHEHDATGNTTDKQGYGCSNRENVSSAIVTVPSYDTAGNAPSQQDKNMQCFYKFVMKHFDSNKKSLLYVAPRKQNDESPIFDEWRPIQTENQDMVKFIRTVTQKPSEKNIRIYLTKIFKKQNTANYTEVPSEEEEGGGKTLIEFLSDQIVFTFPLHSIGPLQWSKSPRICLEMREDNYSEAENRCEIIRYFFENGDKFDKNKEKEYFRVITQTDNNYFARDEENGDCKVSTPDGKYRLLKLPEGIYEAKIISILLSSKKFKTVILEEPDRGMHPQFVDRMMQVIKQSKEDKRVILTTHNKALITPWSLPNCFVFRNIANKGDVKFRIFPAQTIVGAPTANAFHMKKLRQLTTDHVSDIFFARKILFFEGDSELLFFSELKQHILLGTRQQIPLSDSDYTQLKKTFSELTLIKMNGKGMATFCHDICKNLELEHLVIVDRDSVRQNTKNINKAEKKTSEGEVAEDKDRKATKMQKISRVLGINWMLTMMSGLIRWIMQSRVLGINWMSTKMAGLIRWIIHSRVLGINWMSTKMAGPIRWIMQRRYDEAYWLRRREEELCEGNFFWIHGDIEDMVSKMFTDKPEVLRELKDVNVTLNPDKLGKRKATSEKLFLRDKVTPQNVKSAVEIITNNCTDTDDLYQLMKELGKDRLFKNNCQ